MTHVPTPLHLKPPIAAWITSEARRLKLKPRDIADRLSAQGLDVTEATVKVWESNADRRPNPYNLEGLERIFGSKAPQAGTGGGDMTALVAALDRQATSISELVAELRLARAEDAVARRELMEALGAALDPRGMPGGAELDIRAGAPR